jgi:hypothetical protein
MMAVQTASQTTEPVTNLGDAQNDSATRQAQQYSYPLLGPSPDSHAKEIQP